MKPKLNAAIRCCQCCSIYGFLILFAQKTITEKLQMNSDSLLAVLQYPLKGNSGGYAINQTVVIPSAYPKRTRGLNTMG